MGDRTGVGMVELAILESLEGLQAVPNHPHIKCLRVLDTVEERIGLAPGYAYEILVDLSRPWTIPIRLVDFHGSYGSRDFPPAQARYCEARLSPAGELALASERDQAPPVPIGLINGNTYRQGTRPPLNPERAINALRLILANPQVSDDDILRTIGPPDLLTGCVVSGPLSMYQAGRSVELRLTGHVEVTGDRHVTIRTLPPNASPMAVIQTIEQRLKSPAWSKIFPDLDHATRLPIAEVQDLSHVVSSRSMRNPIAPSELELRITCTARTGVDLHELQNRLQTVPGVVTKITVALREPLANILRNWVASHEHQNIPTGLDALAETIRGNP